MGTTKLYRKDMAELAGMTPVQHDYFVRIGAFAPNEGTSRKWYSPIEASLVMIAGQLMPFFKDQRQIVGVMEGVRQHLMIDGRICKSAIEAKMRASIYDAQKDFDFRARYAEKYEGIQGAERKDVAFIGYLILSLGYLPDLNLLAIEKRNISGPSRAEMLAQRTSEIDRLELRFAKECCRRRGLDFEESLEQVRQVFAHAMSRDPYLDGSSNRAWHVYDYFTVVAGNSGGINTLYLQVAANEDGSADLEIFGEPVALENRILWMTLDLGKLFKRLSPFIPDNFIPSASKQFAEWEAEE